MTSTKQNWNKTRRIIATSVAKTMLLTSLAIVTVTGVAQSRSSMEGGFVVIDSSGQAVGPVISNNQGGGITTVAVPFRGKWLPVATLRDAILSGSLFFTSSDCSGQPFGDASSSPFPASAVAGPKNTLYFEDGPIQNISVGSTLSGGYICDVNGCTNSCYATQFALAASPMSPAKDLNALKPPFRVVRAEDQRDHADDNPGVGQGNER